MSIETFLTSNGWGAAQQQPLAGDASSRRYIRLYIGSKQAILMIDPDGDTSLFATLSEHLTRLGLSAPAIYARTDDLMLLEDFGDAQFARVVETEPDMEFRLYQAATDVLCHLETQAVPEVLRVATQDVLANMVEPAFTHYLPMLQVEPNDAVSDIITCLSDLLHQYLPTESVLVLRDFHAENMIWLPEREGVRRVGLLDFQDAVAGPPVYDLVSLLQDARRDVSDTCQLSTLQHFLNTTGRQESTVMPIFHLLGVQRNLRILGIFARLAKERGKPGYLSLIPRVWQHIEKSLSHPAAKQLEPLVRRVFPTPTAERLRALIPS
ncbi:phosphotransferase [Marivita sp. XM-24bin2]|jgi:aminoglycoside/choline kinase family phosphotransferase|uniref:aminoglycoside phosphotransferase family protein n=1 Tax=unclassified Marivita TaxID=2632480 RepID=UPI000D79D1D7|nr:phosphotransferase [Marivita sp. XM-24bin2]MCR9110164.1 phosphotransferase [Paracoccaceae bacterium]PWL34324.1 MAG: aminoglycoside phosphotransferase [Marivita sp. XM-24bin2]